MIGMEEELLRIENVDYRSGFTSLTVLPQKISTYHIGLIYQPLSPFCEAFNEKLRDILSSGFIDDLYKNFLNPKGRRRLIEPIGPQVLTLEQLSLGFQVCLILWIVSIVAFCCEFATLWFQGIREYFVIYFTVRALATVRKSKAV